MSSTLDSLKTQHEILSIQTMSLSPLPLSPVKVDRLIAAESFIKASLQVDDKEANMQNILSDRCLEVKHELSSPIHQRHLAYVMLHNDCSPDTSTQRSMAGETKGDLRLLANCQRYYRIKEERDIQRHHA